MAINFNIQVARAVPQVNNESTTLVIFRNARGFTQPTRVNTLAELYADATTPTTILQVRELYVAEYLLRAGVNLLCLSTEAVDVIAQVDIDKLDLALVDFKLAVVPYYLIDLDTYDTGEPYVLEAFVKENDVQLFLDLDPEMSAVNAATIISEFNTLVGATSKIELFYNAGLATFTSNYTIANNDFPLDFDTDFYGVPASALVVARKVQFLNAGTPWLPVAGQTYGAITEVNKLYKTLKTTEKAAFQAANINVLHSKVGLGNLMVSQNTLANDEVLVRSHVVTEALYIKRRLTAIAENLKFLPNNLKTWTSFELKAADLFEKLLAADGIEEYSVSAGLGKTMTQQNVVDGKFVASVSFLPIRVIEEITFNITIQETLSQFEVIIEENGGDL